MEIKKWKTKALVGVMVGILSVETGLMVQAAPEDKAAIENQKKEALSKIGENQKKLTSILTQINDLEHRLIEQGQKIEAAKGDLEVAKEREKKQRSQMKLRIRYMYEDGGVNAIEELFASGSMAEFVNRAQYMAEVQSYDQKMLKAYLQTKLEITSLKDTLEKDQKKMLAMDKEMNKQSARLVEMIDEGKKYVASLDQKLQVMMQEEQKKAVEQAMIAARKEAEERQRKLVAKKEEQERKKRVETSSRTTQVKAEEIKKEVSPAPRTEVVRKNETNQVEQKEKKPEPVYIPKGNTAGEQIVNAARSQLGVPYVWGGTRPGEGLDCSGLTQFCYKVAGIRIPRTSGEQLAAGTRVDTPEPGDICWTPGHVAIYIGNGQMIEAPDIGQKVKVSKVRVTNYIRFW